ncbi:MAG: DUF1801 domain-containing protein [Patescibacteria group bacterium]
MEPAILIDKRIAEFPDWRGKIFAQLRNLINTSDPTIEEGWKWDTAVWSHNELVCAIGVFKETVKLNFFQGAALDDPKDLFNAGLEAKKTRAIDFRENDPLDGAAIQELIKAAIAFNNAK